MDMLTKKQSIIFIAMFVIGSTLITQGTQKSMHDTWIAILIAFFASVPILLLYARLQTLYPNQSLYDLSFHLTGRFGGAIITVLFILFFFSIGILSQDMFLTFVRMNNLPKTPKLFLSLPFCLIAAWLASLSHSRKGKIVFILFCVVILYFTISMLFSIVAYNPENLLPIADTEPKTLLNDALSYFSIPMTQTVVLLCILHNTPAKTNYKKMWLIGGSIGASVIVLNMLRTILVLGDAFLADFYHVGYWSASVIRISSFIQRIEIFIISAFLACLLVKLAAYIFAVGNGIQKLIPRIKKQWIFFAVALLMAMIASFLFDTTEESFRWFEYTRIYSLLFQVLIPCLLWIVAEYKSAKKRKYIK